MKSIRTNRSGLFLIEMVIVILFFSVTAAICVRLFAAAALTSRSGARLSNAVLLTESAAETVKSCEGDGARFAQLLGAESSGDGFIVYYDKEYKQTSSAENAVYSLSITPAASADGAVDYAVRFSSVSDDAEIYTVSVAAYPGKEGAK